MEGCRLGPYRVQTLLGSGGMGQVYAAVVEADGAPLPLGARVALKVVHPHLLARPGSLKRFLREADAGRRVRHENVVRTYEIDSAELDGDTLLFLAMELVEGRTLRDLLTELSPIPETLLREIARQIAEGLSAIHEAGVVHRDLKPENVLLTPDHRVRIMDLGVARLIEESVSLTQEGCFAGSLLYAAPEQFRGGDVGPAADLYALGVLLYELGSGANPYRHDDPAAVIRAHLEDHPEAMDAAGAPVSPFFAAVADTLLAKNALERFPSASRLARVLAEGEASSWWAECETHQIRLRAALPSVPVRRDTGLFGRGAELDRLREAWESARQGHGRVVLIEGEAGVGKTRLCDEFLRTVATEEARLLYGAYLPTGGMGAFSEAILHHFGASGLEASVAPFLEVTPALVPGFAAIVRHERPAGGVAALDGNALHTVMAHLVRGLAAEKPMLWIAEDLHNAPTDSRRLAISLARAVGSHRVLLVLTTRPGLPEEDVANLSRLETVERFALDRLSPREVMDLLCDAFRSRALAEKLGGRIAWKSDGVPFFVFEMLRGLREGRFIEESPGGGFVETKVVEEIEVPSAVRDLIVVRLKDLSREERTILDVGAVEGFEFDAALAARVLGMKTIPVLQALAEIERRSGLVRASGRLTRFDHNQVRDVLYGDLPEALRLEYHAALADARAATDGVSRLDSADVPPETSVFLATHHLQGSRPAEGLPHLDRALDQLGRVYRHEEVGELVDRALSSVELVDAARRCDLLLVKAAAMHRTGRWEAEGAALEEAVRLADERADEERLVRSLSRHGGYLVRTSRYEDAVDVLARARALASRLADVESERSVAQDLGVVACHRAHYDEGREHFEAALALAQAAGDRRGEAAALGGLGTVHRAHGRSEEALAHHHRNLALVREVGDRHGVITALGNIGNVLTGEGRWEEAREHYEEALTLARETGDRYAEAILTGNLGGCLLSEGLYAEALQAHERALVLAREVGNRLGETNVVVNLGRLRLCLGDREGAREHYAKACVLAADTGATRLEGYARMGQAELAEECGDVTECVRLLEQAREIFEAIHYPHGVVAALRGLGDVRERGGDRDGAQVCYAGALDVAATVGDGELALGARLRIACLTGDDVAAARSAWRAAERRAGTDARLACEFQLWQATGDDEHLERAWGLLQRLVHHAPASAREDMVARVRLYRDVAGAWGERRTASDDAG